MNLETAFYALVTQWIEWPVSTRFVGSSNLSKGIGGYGGNGRRARLRI